MTKLLLILNVFLTTLIEKPAYVKGRRYEGYIFSESHFLPKSIADEKSRYAPTASDIANAEQLLQQQLSALNEKHINQVRTPIIDRQLKKYVRQYVGFLNRNGEKILWVNCVSKVYGDLKPQLATDIVQVSDGGSYFWSVEINITRQKVYNLDVNGYA